ncbi:MAG: PAS domain-containing protein [Pseudomonadota bacterium]
MTASGEGLRVLTKRNPYFSQDPQIVIFKLDPATRSFTEVHGSPEALVGHAPARWLEAGFWPAMLHPDDREEAQQLSAICTGAVHDHALEYRVVHADGQVVWIHEIVGGATKEDRTGLLTGYLMNITNRVAHERDVHEALGMKDELLRVVSQELSQPVNKITDFGDLLMRHLSKQGDDVGSDYAIGLREGVEELTKLVDGLLKSGQIGGRGYDEVMQSLAALRDEASDRS